MRKPETKLERHVAGWLREQGRDYDNKAEGAYQDLMQGGCQSGMVGHLIYYHDTIKFFKRYLADINILLTEAIDSSGLSIHELFGDKWDKEDPLARETANQNLLAWFGFEEAARNLMEGEED